MILPANKYQMFWLVIASLFLISTSYAEEEAFVGKYDLIKTPQPTNNSEKIEIVELFWYNCPHCYQFEQQLGPWLKNQPADVEVIFMPAVFSEGWAVLAKAYYTAEILGVLDKVHHALFEALHVQHRKIKTEQEVQAFFVEQGVEPQAFDKIYNAFSVDTKTRRATLLTRQYGITGVPALVVNGKYRISGSHVTSYGEMVEVVNYLIQKERALKLQESVGTPATSDPLGTPSTITY
jgi:thiol:disulfide interchange protein DsbA